jgi:hypothetical protein
MVGKGVVMRLPPIVARIVVAVPAVKAAKEAV